MKAYISVYDVGLSPVGLINTCCIEEVWLNPCSNSVAIRYRSPNGRIVDHEEYYDTEKYARFRFSIIARALDCEESSLGMNIKKHIKKFDEGEMK